MLTRFSTWVALATCLFAAITPALAQGLSTPQYRLKVHPKAKIVERVDTGWEVLMTVELDGERARVRWKPDGFTAIYPNGTLRAQLNPQATAAAFELTTDFEGKRYKIIRTAREVSWKLAGQDIFFRTYGGKVSNVVGTSDYLNITRDTRGGRLSLESQAGTSDVLLKGGKLEVFEGPGIAEHTYFVRGLAFRRGPLTLEVPLPEEPFLKALPADRFLLVESQSKPAATDTPDETPAFEAESLEGNPLQAEPSSWESPVYRTNPVDRKEDPMNARREVRASNKDRPLDARTAPDSEDILRVKGTDEQQ